MNRKVISCGAVFFLALPGLLIANAADYGRFAGGSWHSTQNTWRIGSGDYTGQLPGAEDAVRLVSKNETIELSEAPVSLLSLNVGSWDAGLKNTVTLTVRTNLTAKNLTIGFLNGAPASQWGNGELIVSGTTVAAGGTTSIGGTGSGRLKVINGGKFENPVWRIALGAEGKITIDDGIVSMKNSLDMAEGSSVEINGKSELHIVGNNQSRSGSPLLKYIRDGWISGDGVAGNVQVVYDGEKTIVRVSAKIVGDARSCSGSPLI
jgi:hypothetical protein